MNSQMHANYTPITAAAIFRTPPPQHRGLETTTRSPVCSAVSGDEFIPKFQTMSARNRKMIDLYGEEKAASISVSAAPRESLSEKEPPGSVSSNRRTRGESPLIPSTMQWSCSPSVKSIAPICDEEEFLPPANNRRGKSELISASSPWTTPSPYPNPVPTESVDHRKQPLGLLPATMPWVTPIPNQTRTSEPTDHRRKKGLAEEQAPKTGSLFVNGVRQSLAKSPITSEIFLFPDAPSRTPSALKTTNLRMKGVLPDGNEEARVRKLLSQSGLHVVKAKADIDILSNRGTGTVHVSVRHEASCAVVDKIEKIAAANGFGILSSSV